MVTYTLHSVRCDLAVAECTSKQRKRSEYIQNHICSKTIENNLTFCLIIATFNCRTAHTRYFIKIRRQILFRLMSVILLCISTTCTHTKCVYVPNHIKQPYRNIDVRWKEQWIRFSWIFAAIWNRESFLISNYTWNHEWMRSLRRKNKPPYHIYMLDVWRTYKTKQIALFVVWNGIDNCKKYLYTLCIL